MKLKWLIILPCACAALAQTTVSGGMSVQSSLNVIVANASSTGTTVNKLAKLTGAPSTAVISATTDTTGAIGIVVAGAGTTGSAQIARFGVVSLVFDGATTAGDYVQISATTAGDGHDAGATCPTSGQVIGTVQSTNGAGGTYAVLMGSTCPGGGGSSTQQFNNQTTATTYTVQASDCSKIITFTTATAVTLTVPTGLGAGCVFGVLELGAGNITPTASSTTINQRLSLTKTAGQYALIWMTAYAADTFVLTGDLQ